MKNQRIDVTFYTYHDKVITGSEKFKYDKENTAKVFLEIDDQVRHGSWVTFGDVFIDSDKLLAFTIKSYLYVNEHWTREDEDD